jgi:hypothetical protein
MFLWACAGPAANHPSTATAPATAPGGEAARPENLGEVAAPPPAADALAVAHGHRKSSLLLRDGRSGTALPTEAFLDRLRAARAIYAGEQHNSRASHKAQLEILGSAYGVDHELALAVEMLPRRLQPQIDAFLAGSIDEEGFLAAVDWEHTWGFDYGFYRPMFEFCREHGLRIYALNAPRELSRAVRLHGVEGLSPAEQALLPSGYPWPTPEEHRRYIRKIFDSHPSGPDAKPEEREAAFARFYTAQLIWDESMAQAVAEILLGSAGPHKLVVLAGAGHVGPYAIPGRASRRGVPAPLTVAPIESASEPPPQGAEAADILVVIGSEPGASPHG